MCDVLNCSNPGEYNPILLFRVYMGHSPARARIDISVCESCQRTSDVSDIIDDGAWDQLCAMFESCGCAAPTRELTELEWIPIHDD